MCGMTGSNVIEAVAKAAIIFYSNIKHILTELHAALLVYHMLYVTIPMQNVEKLQEMWYKKAWLTPM